MERISQNKFDQLVTITATAAYGMGYIWKCMPMTLLYTHAKTAELAEANCCYEKDADVPMYSPLMLTYSLRVKRLIQLLNLNILS